MTEVNAPEPVPTDARGEPDTAAEVFDGRQPARLAMSPASKLICTVAAAGGIASPLAIVVAGIANGPDDAKSAITTPLMVMLRPGSLRHRPAGDFARAGQPADAPETRVSVDRVLAIMEYQVTAADYQRCVEAHACQPLDPGVVPALDRPAVRISWRDAVSYAGWLSHKTGAAYRLPTDEEWAYARGKQISRRCIAGS